MEKNKFDKFISESLRGDTSDIRMSDVLKDRIITSAVSERPSLYIRFKKLMNTTIEISIPSAVAVCFLICFFTFSAFSITGDMKKDKSIMGYTSVKAINVGGADIIIDNDNEVRRYEKDKN